MTLILFIIGFSAGLSSGTLGISQGCSLVPILQFVGLNYYDAINTSLFSILCSFLSRSINSFRRREIAWEPTIVIGVTGSICAIFSDLVLLPVFPKVLLQLIYTGYMFTTVDMLRIAKQNFKASKLLGAIKHEEHFFSYLFCGIIGGFSTSLIGISGDIFIIAFLVFTMRLPFRYAYQQVVPGLVIIILSSLITEFIVYTIPFSTAIPCAIGGFLGTKVGSITKEYISEKTIVKANYIVCFSLGFLMLFRILFNSLRA